MNILLIDDHPMAIEFYAAFVRDHFSWDETLTISVAFNCEQAYNLIANNSACLPYDIAYVDYRLPAFKSENISSGGDIINLLRKQSQDCKVIIITGHTDALLLYDMMWQLHPEGFAAKCDINFDTLSIITETVERGTFYKSDTITTATKKVLTEKIFIDSINRKIVSLIIQGYKIKDLHKYIDLQPSSIHRRILNIKKSLKIGNSTNIIRRLVENGYVAFIDTF